MRRSRGFTLSELLMVLGIIVLLAALSFPVFAGVQASAKRTTCLSNFHQASLALIAYVGDYDDRFVPVNHVPGKFDSPKGDQTWVQSLMPYAREFRVFHCPGDHTRSSQKKFFDKELGLGDMVDRFYTESKKTNLGYNFIYLAPIVKQASGWTTNPRSMTSASDPAQTIVFADSVESVVNNRPQGGGHWLVLPPCRYERRGRDLWDTFLNPGEMQIFSPQQGWEGDGRKFHDFGHVWPWHNQQATSLRLDGSTKSMNMNAFALGCNASALWRGEIYNTGAYLWDLR